MTEFEGIAMGVIKCNLDEARLHEIYEQCGLSIEDRELVNEIFSKWKPDFTLAELATLPENYKDRPNIYMVMHACKLIAHEAAEVSELRRLSKNN